MTKLKALVTVLALAFGTTGAIAQSTGGSPADPNTSENQQPAPGLKNPADPAAGSQPGSRIPTAPPEMDSSASEGAGSGETGLSAPAGNPADPNTDENQQVGPSVNNPTDPATGSEPGARVPTSPPGTASE